MPCPQFGLWKNDHGIPYAELGRIVPTFSDQEISVLWTLWIRTLTSYLKKTLPWNPFQRDHIMKFRMKYIYIIHPHHQCSEQGFCDYHEKLDSAGFLCTPGPGWTHLAVIFFPDLRSHMCSQGSLSEFRAFISGSFLQFILDYFTQQV